MIPACPPLIIIGVYHPTPAIKANGCVYRVGTRGAITVPFYKTQADVPLLQGQQARYAPGSGYCAYPPN